MARAKIREFDAKKLILEKLNQNYKGILVDSIIDIDLLPKQYPWLLQEKLTVKPDQLFGKRGKLGLVLLSANFEEVKKYLQQHLNEEFVIGKVTDRLTHFLIEPYIEHEEEYYLSITSERNYDTIHFSEAGGINVEENWDKISTIKVPVVEEPVLEKIPASEKVREFIKNIFAIYRKSYFSYLEFNPFTLNKNNEIFLLDTVAQVDSCGITIPFPKPFGRNILPEEEYIAALDKESGASLKLTVLNQSGRIWSILSGGGASIIYLDAIADLGKQEEIANYGEYSGNPTAEETYQYTKTILCLMTKQSHPNGKVLIIGGGIANFTDIKETFTGVIKALRKNATEVKKQKIKIYVRRGGPNYKQGLEIIKTETAKLGIYIEVYGPETYMTHVVSKAVKGKQL